MKQPWLSVIIPSYKDPYLHDTIDSLLINARLGDRIEILPVLDGYWPEKRIRDDPRIRIIHKGKNEGMREAINTGVAMSRGRYIMRTDEHCMFAPGYDKELVTRIQRDWIVTPLRYFLDPVTWTVMDKDPVVYERLAVRYEDGKPYKFEGRNWKSRTKERVNTEIDETMAMQGSCWVMKRKWWDEVVGPLQTDGYGPMYQDSHEMVFKTWQKGGKLMVNKRTWYAHKHVSFPRTHQYSKADYDPCLAYTLTQWLDYYEKEVAPKWNV